MTAQRRADVALVARGLFGSRAKAAEAIAAGLVRVDGRAVMKASEPLSDSAEVEAQPPYLWVSRGGVKLAAALDTFSIDPADCACLDVGASTGGFTDVLLTRGARHVTAVDVGRGQIDARLAADHRVTVLEKTDARALTPSALPAAPSLITIDVSFISLRLILPAVLALAAPAAHLVALVKPQFEVGPAKLKKGIVRSEVDRQHALQTASEVVHDLRWHVTGHMLSPITGGNGNIEYLLAATYGAP